MRPLEGLLAGRYTIGRVIGHGATATVHLARDERTGVDVAIKLLRPELSQSAASERFLREIERTAALQHPGILPVLDSGEHHGQPYFVLPFMEGGTLRDRLTRESQLPIADALVIAKQVAEALDYAHARGLIHRDIKPENILFSRGVAHVGDFGIARALQTVYGDGSTSSATIRGTPAYMSPEQAAGGEGLDHRSDVYALACVIYEMITGMQAFMGPTPESVMAQRFQHTPREIKVYRATAPSALDAVLLKAFALSRADRYASCGAFVSALETAASEAEVPPGVRVAPVRRRAAGLAAAVGVIALTAVAASRDVREWLGVSSEAPASPLDSTRFAVFSEAIEGDSVSGTVVDVLRESLARWRDIAVVDAFHARDALRRDHPDVSPDERARRAAELLGAGRYIRVDARPVGDSLSVRAMMFDTRSGSRVGDGSARIPRDVFVADTTLARLASALLFPDSASAAGRIEALPRTSSYAAHAAFLRGHAALRDWDLARADSQFLGATEVDAAYAEAFLWLAQVRFWKGEPPSRWGFAAERAAAPGTRLASRDSALARALHSVGRGDPASACATLAALAQSNEFDFAAWYGLGRCLAGDAAVVRDASSATGWAFRSSYAAALRAFEHAFRLVPSIHHSFRDGAFQSVQRLFMTSASALRRGNAVPPDSERFLAYPSWVGDSLAFVPVREAQFNAVGRVDLPPTWQEATLNQRRRFFALASMWRSSYPRSVDAMAAMAIALDLLGDPSAFDSLRVARLAARDPDVALRLGVAEVWMRVKHAVPGNTRELQIARALADSLLASAGEPDASTAAALSSLAALTGRAVLAAGYATVAEAASAPPAVARLAPALLAYAAMGGPGDTIRALDRRLVGAMDRHLVARERQMVTTNWLTRAAALAVPGPALLSVAGLDTSTSYRLKLLAALRANDVALAKRTLEGVRRVRQSVIRASDVAPDGLYSEAAVLVALGDSAGALAWLRPTLDSLSGSSSHGFESAAIAGALVRAMALRATLEWRHGDARVAAEWASAVLVLWSSGDEFVQTNLQYLARIAR
jgi:tRNA A-37 threonylcarbamoyl transferase component Bud32